MKRILLVTTILSLIGFGAEAQCVGAGGVNTINNCAPATAIQPGDLIPIWQIVPNSTRKAQVSDILNMLATIPITGLTSTGPIVGPLTANGGTIDNTVIGSVIPAAGTFSALTVVGPLNAQVTATGSTTARYLTDRFNDRVNVKDYGALLDGVTNDHAAIVAAYNAAGPAGGIYVPRGGWVNNSSVGLSRATGGNLFILDGNSFSTGTTPVTFIGDGNVTETFATGRKSFWKQLTASANGYATVDINVRNTTTAGILNGVVASLVVNGTDVPGASGFLWPLSVVLNAGATGGVNNQDVAIAATVNRTTGGAGAATWQYFGQSKDLTGYAPTNSSAMVGFEQDHTRNGPETSSINYAPHTGNSDFWQVVAHAYSPPSWTANTPYAQNTVVQSSPSNGFTYIATTGGTSGGSPPTWPTSSGTVTDGTVVWTFGTTIATQVSRIMSWSADSNAEYGAGVTIAQGTQFLDAILEFSFAALDSANNPTAAAIRLAPNMPIDFSGNQTLPGQNKHILNYTTTPVNKLQWIVNGTENVSFPDTGGITLAGTTATGFGTNIGQVPLWINFNGTSNLPGLNLAARTLMKRQTPGVADFSDLEIQRVTTSIPSGGTGNNLNNLNAAFRVATTIGPNDATQEYGIISQTINNGTAGGIGYAGFFTSQRPAGITGGAPIVGLNAGAADSTTGPSSAGGAGAVVGTEIHAGGQQADDAFNGQSFANRGIRKLIHLSAQHVVADSLQAEISHGIWAGTVGPTGNAVDPLTNFDSLIGFITNTQVRIGLDMRGVIAPAGSTDPVFGMTLSAGQCIDFNGSASLISNPGGSTLCYNSGTSKWVYSVAGVAKWSVDNNGNARFAGTVTGSVTP